MVAVAASRLFMPDWAATAANACCATAARLPLSSSCSSNPRNAARTTDDAMATHVLGYRKQNSGCVVGAVVLVAVVGAVDVLLLVRLIAVLVVVVVLVLRQTLLTLAALVGAPAAKLHRPLWARVVERHHAQLPRRQVGVANRLGCSLELGHESGASAAAARVFARRSRCLLHEPLHPGVVLPRWCFLVLHAPLHHVHAGAVVTPWHKVNAGDGGRRGVALTQARPGGYAHQGLLRHSGEAVVVVLLQQPGDAARAAHEAIALPVHTDAKRHDFRTCLRRLCCRCRCRRRRCCRRACHRCRVGFLRRRLAVARAVHVLLFARGR